MSPSSSSSPDDFLDLAVNSGSSSIKFQLFNSSRKTVLKGSANVSDDSASYKFSHAPSSAFSSSSPELSKSGEGQVDAKSYEEIFRQILGDITSEEVLGEKGVEKIRLVAHRIVHGGTADGPILIKHGDKEEKEVLDKMEEVSAFAPLHVRLFFSSLLSFTPCTDITVPSSHTESSRHAHRQRVPPHPPLRHLRPHL
jgi:acetate kinase